MSNILNILCPGKVVETSVGVAVRVHPMGLTQMKKFSQAITLALAQASEMVKLDPEQLKDPQYLGAATTKLMGSIAPFAIVNLLDLVADCCHIEDEELVAQGAKIEMLPAHDVACIVDAWVEETFEGEGKMKPWVDLVNRVLRVIFKKEVSISDMLSNYSSPQATIGED